jgi:hypothetical protein
MKYAHVCFWLWLYYYDILTFKYEIYLRYQNFFPASSQTRCISIRNTNWTVLLRNELTLRSKNHTKHRVEQVQNTFNVKAGGAGTYCSARWYQGRVRMLVSVACPVVQPWRRETKSTPTTQGSSALATIFGRYSGSTSVSTRSSICVVHHDILQGVLIFCVNPSECVRSSTCSFDRPFGISLFLSLLCACYMELRANDVSG